MEIKVSVVSPVYNGEKYIEECLDSLLNQTLKEIEVICVDDGSNDGTMDILRRYQAEDNRVKVIQQKNMFAGVARNNGMKIASGEYIMFLDSDDFFEHTMLEEMYAEAKRTDADVVLCAGQIFDEMKQETIAAPWFFKSHILPQELPFSYRDTDGQLLNAISPAPWTKLFRRSFVEKSGLQFQPLQNSNDAFFIISAVCTAERISYVDKPFVNYRRGMTTNLQSNKHKNPLCFMEAYTSAYRYLNEQGVYDYVKKGFRSMVISGCLYNYDSYPYWDVDSRESLLKVFQEDRFTQMNLLDGEQEEYADWNKRCRLKALTEGYVWKKRLDSVRAKNDTRLLAEARTSAVPKVSVVIPCYNVENYLEECIESILNQTLQEIEVICVNDGSADKTENILVNIAGRDSRVSVYTQSNSGQSVGRNKGVEAARGEYLYFMDSDDFLEADALEKLYAVSKEKDLDVLYFDATCFFESEELEQEKASYKTYYLRQHDYSDTVSGKDMMLAMQKNLEYRQSPCLQFIRRKYFMENDLWFMPGVLHEDNSFTFKTMLLAEKTSHIPAQFFKRRLRGNSTMTSTESFAHVYGLFVNYLDMLKTVENVQLTVAQEAVTARILAILLGETRRKYRLLQDEERFKYQCLGEHEKTLFFNYVVHSKLDVDQLAAEKKVLNQRLRHCNEQLKQKNELLKQRNQEIKDAKQIVKTKETQSRANLKRRDAALREVRKIKRSKTYKLAKLLASPFRLLRRIKRKLFSGK